MLGKMVKVLIAFALGFVMGIVGAFAGVGLGGLYAASNVQVGTVTGYILSDKQNEEYLNEKFRSAYLYDAAKMLIEAENLGVVKNYIPGLEKGLDALLDIELNASNGEKVRVGDLVEIDKAKLYSTTYKNIGDAINAVTVTANIETVLKLLGVNLNDLGFGWIEDLEIYKGAEYSKYPNEGIGDVAFRQISPQEAATYQGSVYTKSGNTYTLVERDDGKTQSLKSVVTYYVLNDGFDYKSLAKYYYVDSSETYQNIYEVGDVKLVNNDEYVIEQVTYLPSVTDLAEVWFMEFPALSKIGLLDIPKVIVRRLKNMPINDFAIALENLVPLDMEYNKLLSAIVGTDENGTINDVLNFDYKNIRLNDIADATKLIPEGSVITSLIDLITTKNGESLGLADTFENLKDLSFNDIIDEFGLGFDLNDYGLDAALNLKLGTIFDGSILNKLKDSYLDKSFDDVIEIVCNITGLKFTLADFGLEDFGKIKFVSIVNGTMVDELKTALYDISVQKVIDVLNKNLKLSIDLADYGLKELGSITVGGLINAPLDTLKDALSGKKVGDVVEKILEKLNVKFDPADYNLERIFDVTFDGIFDGSIGKDFLDAFGSYSFNEIIAIIFEKLLHIDYSLSDFGVGEFGELKLSDIFDGTISDDVMKTLEEKTFNSLVDPISERFKLNFSLDDFGLYEVGELTFGDIFDGTIIDDALEILDDKTINYFIDKITNKFNVKFDLEDFALEAFGTITIGDIVRGQIGEKALDALYSITFDRVLDVVRKYSGLSIDLDYYKLGALKDINIGGVIKGTQLAEMKQALNESGIAAMLSKVGVNVDELGHVQTLIVGGVLGTVAVVTRFVFPKLFKTLVDNRRDTTIGMIMDGIGLNVDLDKFGVEGLKNITIGDILTDLKKAIGDNLGDLSINKIVEVVTNLIGVEFSLYDYDLGGFGELSLGDVLDGTIGEDALNEVKAYTLDRLVGIVTRITKIDFTLADFALESFGGISIGDIFDGTIGQDALDALYAITFGRVIEVVNDKANLNIDLERYKIEDLKDVSLGGAITGDQLDEIHSAMNKCGLGAVLSKFGVNVDELGHIPTLIVGGVFGVVATVTRFVFPKLFKTIADNRGAATIGMIAESLGINLDLSKYHLEGINSLTLGGLFTDVKGEFADKLGYFSINDIVDIVTGIIGADFTLYDYDLGGFGGLSLGDILDGTIGKDALDEAKGYSVDRLIGIVTKIIKVNFTLADFGLEGFGGLSIGDIFDGTIGQDALDALYGISVSRIIDVVNDKANLNINLIDYKLGKLNELTVGSFVDGSALDIVKEAVRESGFEDVLKIFGMTADDLTWISIGIIAGVGGAVALTVKLVLPKLFDTLVENGDKNTVRMLMDSVGIKFTLEEYGFGELETITLADMFGGNIKDVLKDKIGEKTLGSVVDTINDKANTKINLDEYGLKDFGALTFGDIIDGTIGQDAKDILCSKTFGFYLDKILAEFKIEINYADYALDEFLNLTFGDIFDGTIGKDALNIVKSWSFDYILQTVLKNFGKTLTFENETINKLLNLTIGSIIDGKFVDDVKSIARSFDVDELVSVVTGFIKKDFTLKDVGLEAFGDLSVGMIIDGTIGTEAKDRLFNITVKHIVDTVAGFFDKTITFEDATINKLLALNLGQLINKNVLDTLKDTTRDMTLDDIVAIITGIAKVDFRLSDYELGNFGKLNLGMIYDGNIGTEAYDEVRKIDVNTIIAIVRKITGLDFTLADFGLEDFGSISVGDIIDGTAGDKALDAVYAISVEKVIKVVNDKAKLNIDLNNYKLGKLNELSVRSFVEGTALDIVKEAVRESGFEDVLKMLGMTADDLTWVTVGIIAGIGGAVAVTVKLVFPKLFDTLVENGDKNTVRMLMDSVGITFTLADYDFGELETITLADMFGGDILKVLDEKVGSKTLDDIIRVITDKIIDSGAKTQGISTYALTTSGSSFTLKDVGLESFGDLSLGMIFNGTIGNEALTRTKAITFKHIINTIAGFFDKELVFENDTVNELLALSIGNIIDGNILTEAKNIAEGTTFNEIIAFVTDTVNVDFSLAKYGFGDFGELTVGMIIDGTIGTKALDTLKAYTVGGMMNTIAGWFDKKIEFTDETINKLLALTFGQIISKDVINNLKEATKDMTLDDVVKLATDIAKVNFELKDFGLEDFGKLSLGMIYDGTIGQDAKDAVYAISVEKIITVVNDKAKLNINLEDYKLGKLNGLSVGSFVDGSALDIVKEAVKESGFEDVLKIFGKTADDLTWVTVGIIAGVGGAAAVTVKFVFPKLFDTLVKNGDKNTVRMLMDSVGVKFTLEEYGFGELETITLADMFGGKILDVLKDKIGGKTLGSVVDTVNEKTKANIDLDKYGLKDLGTLTFGDIFDKTILTDARDILGSKTFGFFIDKIFVLVKIDVNLADYGLGEFLNIKIEETYKGTIGKTALDIVKGWSFHYIMDTALKAFNKKLTFESETINNLLAIKLGAIIEGNFVKALRDVVDTVDADELVSIVTGFVKKNFTLKDVGLEAFGDLTVGMIIDGKIGSEALSRVKAITFKHIINTIAGFFDKELVFENDTINELLTLTIGNIIDGNIVKEAEEIAKDMTVNEIVALVTEAAKVDFSLAKYGFNDLGELTVGMMIDGSIGKEALEVLKSYTLERAINTVAGWFDKKIEFTDETVNKVLALTFGQVINKNAPETLKETTKEMTLDDIIAMITDMANVKFRLSDYYLDGFGALSLGMVYDKTIGKEAFNVVKAYDLDKIISVVTSIIKVKFTLSEYGLGGFGKLTVNDAVTGEIKQKALDALYAITVSDVITVLNDKAKLNINLADYKITSLNDLYIGGFVDGNAVVYIRDAVRECGAEKVLKVFGKTADDLTLTTALVLAGVTAGAVLTVKLALPKLFDTLTENRGDTSIRMILDSTGIKFTFKDYGFGPLETITLSEMFGGDIKAVLKDKIGDIPFSSVIDTINEKAKIDIDVKKYGVASFFELTFGDIFDGTIKDDAYAKVKEISFIHVINTVAGLFGKVIVFDNETVNKLLELTVGDIIDKSIKDDALNIAGDMTFNEIIAMAATQFNFKFKLSDYDLNDFGELTVGMVVKGKIGKEALNVLKQYSFNRIIRIPLDKIGYELDWGSDTISAIFDLTVGSIIDKHFVDDLKEVAKDLTFKEVADLGFRFAGYKFEVTSETLTKLLALTVGDIIDGSIVKDAKAVAEELSIKEALNIVLGFAGKKIETESKLVDDLFSITAGDIINNKVLDRVKEITAETTFNEAIEVIASTAKVEFDLGKIGVYDLGELKISYIFEKNIKDKALEVVKTYSFGRIIDTVAGYFKKSITIDSTYINELLTLTLGDVMDGNVKERAKEITANMTFDEVIEFVTKLMGVKFSLADYKLDEFGKLTLGMIFVTKDLKQQVDNIVYNWSIEDVINKVLSVNGNILVVENEYIKKIIAIKLEVVIKGDISEAIFDIVGDMSIRDLLSVADVELTVLEDYGLGGILDLTVNELKSGDVSDKIKSVIDGVKLVDVLGSETIENNELLKSIAYDKDGTPVTIGSLSTRIDALTIGELVEGYADGDNFKTIRAIIPADTKITEISSVDFNANILNLTIGDFENFKLPTLVYKAMGFGVQGNDGNWYKTEADATECDTTKSHLSIKLTEIMEIETEDFMNLTADDLFGELTKENDGLFYTVTHKDGKALTFNELKGRINTLTVSEIIDGYETNAEFELIRKIIAPDTVVTAIGTNLTTEKILSSITLKDIGLSDNESIRSILGYTYRGTDGNWYNSSESAAAMEEGTDYENVTVNMISTLFDVKNVLNMKASDVGVEVGTMPAALRKVLGYTENENGEWLNKDGNDFNDITVNELTNITTDGFKNLALSDVLSEDDVANNKILSLLYKDKTVTLANIGEKINDLSLKDIIGDIKLIDKVEITADGSYVADTVLYTLDDSTGTNVYTMVEGATLGTDGKYTYNSLKTGTYYKIDNTSKVWFITFMEMENDSANNVAGAVTKLTEKKLTLNDLGELNKIQLGGTKLKVLLDIGLLSGTLKVAGYDMTMNQLISNIPDIGA